MAQKWFLQKRIILPVLVLFPPLGIPLAWFSSSEPQRTVFGLVSFGLILITWLSYQPALLNELQQSDSPLHQVQTTSINTSSLPFPVDSRH